jgi:hypothetical protein
MSEAKRRFEELLEDLKRQRQEIAVQIHLGKAEVKKEWQQLESKWEELKKQSGPALEVMGDSAKGVGAALDLAREELEKGYRRLRELLKEKE